MKKYIVLLAVLLVGLTVGCGSVSPRPDIEGISYGIQPYPDLLVPQDFKFDDSDRSWAYRRFENSALNLRCGKFRYVGDDDVGQLINWYDSRLQEEDQKEGVLKWKKLSLDKDEGGRKARMVFTKGTESLIVDIERKTDPTHPEPYTVITLTLGVATAI